MWRCFFFTFAINRYRRGRLSIKGLRKWFPIRKPQRNVRVYVKRRWCRLRLFKKRIYLRVRGKNRRLSFRGGRLRYRLKRQWRRIIRRKRRRYRGRQGKLRRRRRQRRRIKRKRRRRLRRIMRRRRRRRRRCVMRIRWRRRWRSLYRKGKYLRFRYKRRNVKLRYWYLCVLFTFQHDYQIQHRQRWHNHQVQWNLG